MSPAIRLAVSVAVAACLLTPPVRAADESADPTTTSATAPAGVQQLKVVIAEVTGLAQFRKTPQDKWQKAVAGTQLDAGGEIRTGPRSKVICTIEPDQAITIDRLGTISIAEAIRSKGKTTTELLMKYGRTDYVIEAAGKEHDATIRTPNATLAVRGTAFTAYDQPPFEPSVQTYRGVVDFTYAKRLMAVAKGGAAKARKGAAETALDASVVDPAGPRARTASENVFIANEVSRGATLGFDQFAQIATLSGGSGPQTDTQLMAALPGRLNFVIRWNTPGTDFNLAVLKLAGDPLSLLGSFSPQEVLYPGFGLDTTKSGGRILFDDRGGPNGGQEVGFYNKYEPGIYGLQALQAGGPAGTVSFSAYLDGKPQTLFATELDKDGNPVPRPDGGFVTEFSNTITRNVAIGDVEVATALIPFPSLLLPTDDDAALVKKTTAATAIATAPQDDSLVAQGRRARAHAASRYNPHGRPRWASPLAGACQIQNSCCRFHRTAFIVVQLRPMRKTTLVAVSAAVASLTIAAQTASANLVLTRNGKATVSSLSNQLLDHPRSAAGRYKTVWDADPPEPAVSGEHFFLYNVNADGTPEADTFDAKSLTVTGIAPGPGYRIDSALILVRGQGSGQGNFFTTINPSTSYDDPNVTNDFSNYIELGVVEVKFTLVDATAAGLIGATDDSTEQAYAGAGTRGDEHFRIFTSTRAGHDNDVPRAAMSTLVPTAFYPASGFDTGYLDFGNGDVSTGLNVAPAAINTVVNIAGFVPEPGSLALLGTGGLVVLRRRRR